MRNIIAVIAVALLSIVIIVGGCTIAGEGKTLDAVLYNNKSHKLINALENEDFAAAAEYLTFYGSENTEEKRQNWISDMENLDIEIFSANYKSLSADDGIVKTAVQAYFPDGHELCFDVVVQGKGLAISAVRITGDDSMTETLQKAMTTYNPG